VDGSEAALTKQYGFTWQRGHMDELDFISIRSQVGRRGHIRSQLHWRAGGGRPRSAVTGAAVRLLSAELRGQRLPEGALAALPERTGSAQPYVPYTPLFAQSVADFDVIAFLRSVTYTRGAPVVRT
jgi:hypothetical protein